MNEHERIEAMVASGRITRAQADQLLAVLAEADDAEQSVAALQETPGERPESAQAFSGAAADAREARSERDTLDPELHWLELDTFAGNIEVTVIQGLTAAEADGGNLVSTASGARLTQWDDDDKGPRSFIDKLVDGFKAAHLKVRIPAGWGVHFDVKGGEIDIDGPVAAVKGHLRAGDLSVKDTAHADVTVTAGEAEIGLRANSGSNRIQVRVGQADVRFLPGSNLDVTASISVGEISGAGFAKDGEGIGAKASGHVGNGGSGGSLDVSVVTGDINFRDLSHG